MERMIWRGSLTVAVIAILFCRLSSAQQTCCSNEVTDSEVEDGVNLEAVFSTIELPVSAENLTQWDLQVNISWSRIEGFDRYIVEILAVDNADSPMCNPFLACTFDGVSTMPWRVFSGVQFGSVIRVTMFITEVGESDRGPYVRDYPKSPDCYDETKSIDFCKTQPVQYAGKPIDVEIVNMTLTDDEDRVNVSIGWRQPAHINSKTTLNYYQVFWSGEETAINNIRITDVEFEPGAYVTAVLDEPLFLNTSYSLEVSAVVLDSGVNQRGLIREIVFVTLPPIIETAIPLTTESNTLTIALVAAGCVIVVVILTLIFLWKMCPDRFNRLGGKDDDFDDDDILDPEIIIPRHGARRPTLIAYPAYELARSDIFWTERKELGRGYYGEVYKCSATIDGVPMEAAVKVPKQFATSTEIEDFIHEISLVIKLGEHPNLVRFLGCCTTSDPLMMVNEYVRYGDMFSFMQKIKNKKAPKEKIYDIQKIDQLNIAKQIARGMEYISAQRCVHGDLAARNVLVDENLIVKITDFGLSRDIYASNYVRLTKEAKLPWKWYSLEAMTGERKLTTKGDVWSFGVVLFEIFTFCDPPYPLIPSLSALVEMLESGKRMKQPPACPDGVYSIMMKCWDGNPKKRPDFTQLIAQFDKLICVESSSDYLAIFDSSDVTSLQPPINDNELLSPDDITRLSETSSLDSRKDGFDILEIRSNASREDVDYENVLFPKSTYTTDMSGNVLLDDGTVQEAGGDGYIVPMNDDENKYKDNTHSRAKKITSLKDTKYDALPLVGLKASSTNATKRDSDGTTEYTREDSDGGTKIYGREDSDGYMAPGTETTQNTRLGPKYDVFVLDKNDIIGDIQFENESMPQDNEGYTEIDDDDNDTLRHKHDVGDILFEDEVAGQDNDGYTKIDDDDNNPRSGDVNDILFENDPIPQNDSGYTEIDDEDDDAVQHIINSIHTKESLKESALEIDPSQADGMQRYWSRSSDESRTLSPKIVDRDDKYFGKETVQKRDSRGYTIAIDDDKYSRGFNKKNVRKIDSNDIEFRTELPQRQDSDGYTMVVDDDKYSSVLVKKKVPKKEFDPNDIYFGNEVPLRQDSGGYTLPEEDDDASHNVDKTGVQRRPDDSKYIYFDTDEDLLIADKQTELGTLPSQVSTDDQVYENVVASKVIFDDVIFHDVVHRQDSSGYSFPDDDDDVVVSWIPSTESGPKSKKRPKTGKRNMQAPTDSTTDILFEDDSFLPVDDEGYILPDEKGDTKQVTSTTNRRAIPDYEIVDYENSTSIKVDGNATNVEDEEVYVNSKVDANLWKKPAFNYF